MWLLEDSVTAFQQLPDGTTDKTYLHRHVFRTAINGAWGEDVEVREGEMLNEEHSLTLSKEWNPGRLSVVAFIYNDDGVEQVTQVKPKKIMT